MVTMGTRLLRWLLMGWAMGAWTSVTAAYPTPVFGAKRYGRAWSPPPPPPLPLYPPRTAPRPAFSPYYDLYGSQDPYTEVVDFYYPLDPYDKYRLYQIPYYYPELPPYAGYYGPEDDAIDEETAIDEDMDNGDIPYGQETWYESRKDMDSNAETEKIFLRNLILAQMYKDAAAKGYRYPPAYYPYRRDDYDEGYVYGEPVVDPTDGFTSGREEEEVRELKSLVDDKPRKQQRANRLERTKHDNIFGDQRKPDQDAGRRASWYPDNEWRPENTGKKRSAGAGAGTVTTTSAPRTDKGQDEVVMPRPASPARPPVLHHVRTGTAPLLLREPSVYDSIKKLLHMQDRLEQKNESRPQKRSYIPSEESLVEQLDSLKKSA